MIQNQNKYTEAFAKAMDIIADKKIDQAEISSTIQGFIIECRDASIGEYLVQYQDSRITTYGDPNINYKKGTKVYVYVPNGDFSQYKIILGATNRIATDYVDDYSGEEYYNVGEDLLKEENIIKMCSYQPGEYIIYPKEEETKEGEGVQLSNNIESIIRNSNYLKIGATIQTNLPREQKGGNGEYGIKITAIVKNSATGEPEEQYFYFDNNSFDGNPQEYTTALYQQVAHWIDSGNFVNIKEIVYYVKNFPHTWDQKPRAEGEEPAADIFLINLAINGSYRLTETERTSVGVILKAKQGYTFGANSDQRSTRKIQASLRVKMRQVDLEKQGAKVYWFIQDLKITSKSPKFLRQGGLGWRCINPALLVDEESNSYEYNSSIAIDIPYREVAYARETRFKCVIIYDGKNYNREFIIINTKVNYKITLESSTGITNFSYSAGHPNLICRIFENDQQKEIEGYNFRWQVTNNQNITSYLQQDVEATKEYNRVKERLRGIQNKIGTPPALFIVEWGEREVWQEHYWNSIVSRETSEGSQYYANFSFPDNTTVKTYEWFYNEYKKIAEIYENSQRVEKNILYNVDLHQVIFKSTFRCSCYAKRTEEDQYGNINIIERFVGTAVLDIKNSQTPQDGYNLIINNGNQVFLYDEDGTSLHCAAIDEPYKIQDLSFTLWYNGNPIQKKDLNGAIGTWQIPLENTMLVVGERQYIEGDTLKIDVKNNYNSSLTNNTIFLTLHYKQQLFQAHTNFVFTKEGQNGTNGTKYHFKLKIKDNPEGIIRIKNKYQINEKPSFEIEPQLWYNGIKTEDIGEIHYRILKDNLNTSSVHSFSGEDTPIHDIILKEEIGNRTLETPLNNSNLMNIIEAYCTNENGYKYYADLPIPIIEEFNSDYIVNLKPGSGFKYVTYKSDGTKPSYDDRLPFEVQILKKIKWEGTIEGDIAETQPVTTYESEGFKYQWEIFPPETKLLTIIGNNNTPSCKVIPKSIFTKGNQVNNAVYLKITKNDQLFAEIHIPIHFMLNKYQNRALNDWNGTSIEINETGGYILTPQVGAGRKDVNKNTFTGVVLGVAETPDENGSSGATKTETGLFAYGDGVRSIFLDAGTGNATFGKAGSGQIKIDVDNDKATIVSNDYKETEFNNKSGQGMQIQFSGDPHIRFGSGKFYVESDGRMHATGGEIAGWQIQNECFRKIVPPTGENDSGKFVGISPGMKIQLPSSYPKSKNGYIDNISFWAGAYNWANGGEIRLLPNFFVTQDGYLFSNSGQIGGWDITQHQLSQNNVGMRSSDSNNPNDFIAFFAGKKNEFIVRNNGYLHAQLGDIAGWIIDSDKLQKTSGKKLWVGMSPNFDLFIPGNKGISIANTYEDLSSPKKKSYTVVPKACFWAGQFDEITLLLPGEENQKSYKRLKQPNFLVTQDGYLYAQYGKLGNWLIGTEGLYQEFESSDPDKNRTVPDKKFSGSKETKQYGVYVGADGIRLGDSFWVDANGNILAASGEIGGCKVTNGGISSSQNENWYIKGGGDAKFTNVVINGADVVGLMTASSRGGFSGGSGSGFTSGPSGTSLAKGVTVDASQVKVDGTGKTLKQWIEDLAVEIVTKKIITDTLWAHQTITTKDLYITSRDVYLSQSLKNIWDAINALEKKGSQN